ncbi:MAG: SDR family oxidoreductase [bacterium]
MKYSLKGRAALITGASQGLGLAIARAYVKAGCNIVMCARNRDTLEKARKATARLAGKGQTVIAVSGDVSRETDARRLIKAALEAFPQLHILVNNAGVYGPKGVIEDADWKAWKEAMQINVMGSVYLCKLVLPHMKSHGYGKIVQLSGGGATNPLPRISAYAASKAAIVRFAETLAEEVRDHHIDVNSIAPGALNTRLLDEVLDAGPKAVGEAFYARAVKQKQDGGTSLDRGAALAVFLASSASDGISGKLISAVWDPWENFPKYAATLRKSDVYTLRRIVPKDRGWDEEVLT